MEFDVMTRATTWKHVADFACRVESAGFSGMLFTEGHQVPWMNITAASLAAPFPALFYGHRRGIRTQPNDRSRDRMGVGAEHPG